MDFFTRLEEVPDPSEPSARVALAWTVRQADTSRALRLVDGMDSGGRVALVRAEAAIAQGRFDEADAFVDRARGDADGNLAADALLVAAFLASARGRAREALGLADEVAALGHVPDRAQLAAAYGALMSVYGDPASAKARLDTLEAQPLSPAAAVFAGVTRAMHDFNQGEHVKVVQSLEPLVAMARALGMLQLRLRMQNTIAAAYSNLDDKESAIAWVEGSLEDARGAGWPIATGEALAFLGNFYREAGHHERARETLAEARATLQAAPGSRGYALACCYLAHVHLASGDAAAALESADEAERVARVIRAGPIVVDMVTAGARALARIGRRDEAIGRANAALAMAREGNLEVWEVDALRALAEIHGDDNSLRLLGEAQAAVERLGGHAESVSILRELAQAHERAGDLAAALRAERAAFEQASSLDARRINNRLLAVEARHQVEKQRIELEHQRRLATQLERLANTDALTGLANRRRFLEAGRGEIERARRYGRSVALVMCDIDHFKSINDRWGHPCGDEVIRAAAARIDAARRAADLAGRLGGEEFALLLPECEAALAGSVAERLRQDIQGAPVAWNEDDVGFTMSFGVASMRAQESRELSPAVALERLIARADAALYEAKAGGRNRVALAA